VTGMEEDICDSEEGAYKKCKIEIQYLATWT
jgi:hypothetical protein